MVNSGVIDRIKKYLAEDDKEITIYAGIKKNQL
ncbi:MAG TPA: hypothetical protein VFD03_12395 [Clostridia bacterium]|nr:hypothetical protein [Clostridia bacterium]